MKELIFECDLCLSRQQHVPATHVGVEVSVGTVKEMFIDLCQKDYDKLLAPVLDTLAKYGYRDQAPKPKRDTYKGPGPVECKLCSHTPPHMKAMSNHVRQVHGLTLTEYREKHGDPKVLENAA